MLRDKIKQCRIEKNLKQEDVAKALGITTQTLLKWEKGDYEPKVSQLKKLSEIYGVPTCELIDDNESVSSEKMRAKLYLLEQLNEEEQSAAMTIIEALFLKSQAENAKAKFKNLS
ncbi:TPA: helix-turn-helix domain-containing protein [Vibrio cholerae]|uniref:RstR-like protein n=1 Tax=Affertcholeramvirus CTXphi TaxID=141904 RepID=Q2PZB7_9VIRU|nr:helix-turn-helix domain-containing protein [Vibrio cholerae]ABC47902.1 RstR-like protein [Vibrio phage CTXphi]EKF9472675.1 helix-turn-helix domain-containing protein [Vibrio cholerae]EKF9726088.1 helix-turn-helix domain-containing protein [Vibrio cholerae]TBN20818.1 helix-turn-helix domain-containing protein [Vibrio cholerae]CAB1238934.1 cryptic phage CTXphi transcriptional repressor RstR [Vibrio cholerae]